MGSPDPMFLALIAVAALLAALLVAVLRLGRRADPELQAQVQAIMSPQFGLMTVLPWHLKTDDAPERLGERYNGAAVVIDVASGDVLAAVSMPDAPRDLLAEDSALLWNDLVNQPMVNRAVAVPYQRQHRRQ